MATIRQKGDKQWHVQVRKRGYPPETRTFSTKTAAQKWATLIEAEMARGMFVSRTEAECTTLDEVLDRYAAEVLPTKRSQAPELSRIRTLREHFGRFHLASLTSTKISEFRDVRSSQVSAQTVIHEINLLNRVLKTATMDWGIALPAGLPTALVRKPTRPRGRDRRVSAHEIATIIEHSESPFIRDAITLAVETALRRRELCELRWEHIDFSKRTAYIPDDTAKTGVARHIPLSTIAFNTLRLMPRNLSGRVFELAPDSISQAFERACRRAKVVGARWHDLRHEAASRLFERNLNVMEVASITGHKTLDMLKRYTHLRAEDLAKKLA
jgi:integrase